MATPARTPGRQVNLIQALALLLAFLLMAGIGGVLSAGLLIPAVAGASVIAGATTTVFQDLPTELAEVPLSQKSTVLANDGTTVLATFYLENRIVVPLEQISPIMQAAVVATEDKRFYTHGGIDPTGMLRAAAKNALTSDTEGASTLTQQYVKNVLIEAAARETDDATRAAGIAAAREAEGTAGISRKLREAKLAIALEQKYTKDEILSRYLNIAQFGASVYGVEAAAQFYFSKHASELNYLDAATLAGVTQSPTRWDPVVNPEQSTTRRNVVLGLMLDQALITQAEYDAGIATPVLPVAEGGYLNIQATGLGCMTANAVASSGYFCDYVTKVISQNPAFGETEEVRKALLYRGGLTITTTLDPRMQQIADEQVKGGIPVDDPSGVASAISVVEPGTGKILAMAQNRIYNNTSTAGPRETAVNYNTDSAYGSSKGFPPGSTFKPFTLVEWLKEGHSLNEVIDATRLQYNLREFNTTSCGVNLGAQQYKFGNAEGKGSIMSVLNATKNSVNSGYIKMASELNLCAIFEGATSLGVHQPNGEPYPVLASNVLGSSNVAPLTMAAAFAAFAANGNFCEPVAITKVVDATGAELPVPSSNCRQALEPRIAAAMNFALGHVFEGTGADVGELDRPSAGKTGTTSHNEHTWFVGYTPQLSTAVWVGFSEGTIPVQSMTINGKYVRNAYGSTIAGPTWKRFMNAASEGMPVVDFSAPTTLEVDGDKIAVASVVGQSEDAARANLKAQGFNVKTSETPAASSAPAGTVAATSPAAGTRVAKGSVVTLTISSGPGDPAAAAPASNPVATDPAATTDPATSGTRGSGGTGPADGGGDKPKKGR
ncbi:penicillin-binding protein [Pengzhenrongella sicca]|uniref:Penicillin-binding protein n=1 Tax=Pengzhenrongella sicca TaxID=2819238 RepID=A0A8A4ZCZ7_9MICO|nr:transglycosylase domain-containing protein [Pengzhenrongella sicca]QTE29225.1 penicillin-binding protein [Pengzhenrongella sicca]